MNTRFAAICGVALGATLLYPSAEAAVVVAATASTTAPTAGTFQTMGVSDITTGRTGIPVTRDVSQTFSLGESITLESMIVNYGGPTNNTSYEMRLYAVPGESPAGPNQDTLPSVFYNASPIVSASFNVTTATYPNSSDNWLTFSFSGDPVTLSAGQLYQFQLTDGDVDSSVTGDVPNILGIRVKQSDIYTGGRVYNTDDDNGNISNVAGYDMFLQVNGTPIPEPASMVLIGLGGALVLMRRNPA